jgi:uncharacterized protein (DUF2062 family)
MGDWRGWLKSHIPRREKVHSYRLLRPFAKQLGRPDLWHLNHRSVPRAVALGLGVGIVIPFMHIVLAAILAIPIRANVMLAGAFTLVVNPLTIPPLYYAAYRIGKWELRHEALGPDPVAAQQASSELSRMLFWLHHASGPIALGIATLALSASIIGYAASAICWRLWLRIKWRRRRTRRQARI